MAAGYLYRLYKRCARLCADWRPQAAAARRTMAERGADIAEAKPEPVLGAATAPGSAANWRQTLWAMVAIQFVTAVANSVLTPIMPLFLPELGVTSTSEIAIWAGIL